VENNIFDESIFAENTFAEKISINTTKIRLCFSKSGKLRFIGHLDFLRAFQQTIRRAGLPAAFSQGFNPHLLISFALPLPLGMESLNDYADLTLENDIAPDEIIKKLNAAAPGGLTIKSAYIAEDKAASIVTAADYSVKTCANAADELHKNIQEILQSDTIIIPKKTKKGIKDTDIRPDILAIELRTGEFLEIFMRLSAGSARFLNPMTVAGLLINKENKKNEENGESEKPSAAAISRLELYRTGEAGEPVSLLLPTAPRIHVGGVI